MKGGASKPSASVQELCTMFNPFEEEVHIFSGNMFCHRTLLFLGALFWSSFGTDMGSMEMQQRIGFSSNALNPNLCSIFQAPIPQSSLPHRAPALLDWLHPRSQSVFAVASLSR
jgi:hypothetical protein